MIHWIELFVYLILFLFNKSSGINEDILLINEPSHNYQTSYTVISTDNNRVKRDQSSNILHNIHKNQNLCEHDIYSKLSNCLYVPQPM